MPRYTDDDFKKRLEHFPPKVLAAISLRAAMRALPLLAYRKNAGDTPFAYWQEAKRPAYALATFRGYGVSLFVNSVTEIDPSVASRDFAPIWQLGLLERQERERSPHPRRLRCRRRRRRRFRSRSNRCRRSCRESGSVRRPRRPRAYDAKDTLDAVLARDTFDAIATFGLRVAKATNSTYASLRAAADASGVFAARAAFVAFAEAEAADDALLNDIDWVHFTKREGMMRLLDNVDQKGGAALLGFPLWRGGEPQALQSLRSQLESDLQSLKTGFEVWIGWYRDRLEGKPVDLELEVKSAFLPRELLAQGPAGINAHLKAVHDDKVTEARIAQAARTKRLN